MTFPGAPGGAPPNLSTSLGLSDPRLRRFMQMSQLFGETYGLGLRIDKKGRLSVDPEVLLRDESTLRIMVGTMTNMIKDEGSNSGFPAALAVWSNFADALLSIDIATLEGSIPGLIAELQTSVQSVLDSLKPKVHVYPWTNFSDVQLINDQTYTYLPSDGTAEGGAPSGEQAFPVLPAWEEIYGIQFQIIIESYLTSLYNDGGGGQGEAAWVRFGDVRWHKTDDTIGGYTAANPYLRESTTDDHLRPFRQIISTNGQGYGEDDPNGNALLYSFRGGGEDTGPNGEASSNSGFDSGGNTFYEPYFIRIWSAPIPRHVPEWMQTSNRFTRIALRVFMDDSTGSDIGDYYRLWGKMRLKVFYKPQITNIPDPPDPEDEDE